MESKWCGRQEFGVGAGSGEGLVLVPVPLITDFTLICN